MRAIWIGGLLLMAVSARAQDKFQRVFNSMAELVQNGGPLSQHSAVTVLGLNTPGDGWAGTFVVTNTATGTNTTTRIYSGTAGKSWERVTQWPMVTRVSFEGDSLVKQVLPTWPDFLGAYSTEFARATLVTNYGNSGDRVSAMNGQFATEAHLNRPTASNQRGWFLMHGGGNDIADGVAAATVYNYLKNEWDAARQDGQKVVAIHVLPRYDFTVYQPTNAASVVELNRLIDSDRSLYDYVVPADVVLSDTANTNLFYDGTHLTVAGANVLAATVARVIEGKAFELVPTAPLGTNGVNYDMVLLPYGRNVSLGTTNTGAKFSAALSYTQPASGISTNTAGLFANNNASGASVNVSILARSSGLARLYWGDENLERNDFIEASFSGANLGMAFGIFGTERAHLNTVTFSVYNLPVYTNNAAATNALLRAGDFYRTGTDPDHVCVVH